MRTIVECRHVSGNSHTCLEELILNPDPRAGLGSGWAGPSDCSSRYLTRRYFVAVLHVVTSSLSYTLSYSRYLTRRYFGACSASHQCHRAPSSWEQRQQRHAQSWAIGLSPLLPGVCRLAKRFDTGRGASVSSAGKLLYLCDKRGVGSFSRGRPSTCCCMYSQPPCTPSSGTTRCCDTRVSSSKGGKLQSGKRGTVLIAGAAGHLSKSSAL